jgi:VWFA-related protein
MKKHCVVGVVLLVVLIPAVLGQSAGAPKSEGQKAEAQKTEARQTGASNAEKPKDESKKPQSKDDVVRISVTLVQVDAVVTDDKGKQVTDLKPEDFQILEDGHSQRITNFSYVSNASAQPARQGAPAGRPDKLAPPVPSAPLRPDEVKRTMALVVDDLSMSFESIAYTRDALKKFVDQQMQPGDLVAILRTGAGIGALQQFTSDKRQLYAAIERLHWNAMGVGGIGAFAPISSDAVRGGS